MHFLWFARSKRSSRGFFFQAFGNLHGQRSRFVGEPKLRAVVDTVRLLLAQ